VGSSVSTSTNILISTDYGTNWAVAGDSPKSAAYTGAAMSDDGQIMFMMANNTLSNVWRSINQGTNWTLCPTVKTNASTASSMACTPDGSKVLAAHTTGGGLEYSTDTGTTWRLIGATTITTKGADLSDDGRFIYAIENNTSFIKSYDGGTTFTTSTVPGSGGRCVECSGDGKNVLLVTADSENSALLISSDYGQTFAYMTGILPSGHNSWGAAVIPSASRMYITDGWASAPGAALYLIDYTPPVFTNVNHTGNQVPAQSLVFDSGSSSNRWRTGYYDNVDTRTINGATGLTTIWTNGIGSSYTSRWFITGGRITNVVSP
jgi:hypothetical protein